MLDVGPGFVSKHDQTQNSLACIRSFAQLPPNLEGMSKEALDAGLSLLRMGSTESTVALDDQIKAGIVMHGSLDNFMHAYTMPFVLGITFSGRRRWPELLKCKQLWMKLRGSLLLLHQPPVLLQCQARTGFFCTHENICMHGLYNLFL